MKLRLPTKLLAAVVAACSACSSFAITIIDTGENTTISAETTGMYPIIVLDGGTLTLNNVSLKLVNDDEYYIDLDGGGAKLITSGSTSIMPWLTSIGSNTIQNGNTDASDLLIDHLTVSAANGHYDNPLTTPLTIKNMTGSRTVVNRLQAQMGAINIAAPDRTGVWSETLLGTTGIEQQSSAAIIVNSIGGATGSNPSAAKMNRLVLGGIGNYTEENGSFYENYAILSLALTGDGSEIVLARDVAFPDNDNPMGLTTVTGGLTGGGVISAQGHQRLNLSGIASTTYDGVLSDNKRTIANNRITFEDNPDNVLSVSVYEADVTLTSAPRYTGFTLVSASSKLTFKANDVTLHEIHVADTSSLVFAGKLNLASYIWITDQGSLTTGGDLVFKGNEDPSNMLISAPFASTLDTVHIKIGGALVGSAEETYYIDGSTASDGAGYVLSAAKGFSGLTESSFTVLASSETLKKSDFWVDLSDTGLILNKLSITDTEAVWKNAAEATWADGAAGWTIGDTETDGNFTNNSAVRFHDLADDTVPATHTVTVADDGVTAGDITVVAGKNSNYTLAGGAATATKLTKYGASTLTLSNANTINGDILLNGGTLVLNNVGALGGTGKLSFGATSGQLKYGDGIAPTFETTVDDLSTRVSGVMRLDLNGNKVTWTTQAKNSTDWLTDVTLSNSNTDTVGALKTSTLPSGTLTLGKGTEWVLNMSDGAFTVPAALKGEGAVRLSGGTVGLILSSTGVPVSLEAQEEFTGKWIFDNYFEKNLDLTQLGKNATVVFDNCASDTDRYFKQGTYVFEQNIELANGGLSLKNGYSSSSYQFTGTWAGDGNFTRNSANIKDSYIFSGDMSGFAGNMTFLPDYSSTYDNKIVFGGADGAVFAMGNLNHVSGTGTITSAGHVVYNYVNDVQSANAYAGTGTLIKKGTNAMTLTKDVTIANVTIEGGILTLGAGVTQLTSTSIANNGALKFSLGSTDMAVNSNISGNGGITHAGSGNVTLNGDNTYQGNTIVSGGGTLTATKDGSFGIGKFILTDGILDLGGKTMGNEMLLEKGSVLQAEQFNGVKNVTVKMTSGAGDMSLGGMGGSALKSIDTSAVNSATDSGPVISGITGGMSLDKLALTVRAGNIYIASNPEVLDLASDRAEAVNLVQLGDSVDTVTVAASKLSFNLNNEATISLLKDLRSQNDHGVAGIAVTNGKLDVTGNINDVSASPLLGYLGFAAIGKDDAALGWKDDGCLYMSGYTGKVYLVTDDADTTNSHVIEAYGTMEPFESIAVEGDQTLKINLPGAPEADREGRGLELKNLIADEGSHILVTNTAGTGNALVDINSEISQNGGLIVSADLSGKNGVDFRKTGEGTTVVDGDINTDGALIAGDGTLILNSKSVTTGSILLDGGVLDIANSITTGALGGTDGSLTIQDGKVLTLTGTDGSESVLSGVTVSGKTTWMLKGNANLKMGEGSRLSGQELEVRENAVFNMGAETHSVSSFNGDGTLKGEGGRLTVATDGSDVFSGQLSGNGTVAKDGSGSLSLKTAGTSGIALSLNKGILALSGSPDGHVAYAGLSTASGTTLKLAPGADGSSNMSMDLGSGNLELANNTRVELSVIPLVRAGMAGPVVTTQGNVSVGSGSLFVLGCGEEYKNPESFSDLSMVLFKGSQASLGDHVTVEGKGLFLVYYTDLALVNDGAGSIVLTGRQQDDNIFLRVAQSSNARAGAELAWDARMAVSESSVLGSALAAMADSVYSADSSTVSKSLAAMAGSSIPSLLTAQKDMLRTQLSQLRNRTVFMGTSQGFETKDLPYYNMWVQATGNYSQLDADGDDSGYKMNSWGGMLGMDCDVTRNLTLGAALTVSYGDFTSNDVDHLSADTEYYYLSMFGRYQSKAWGHTLILTGGWNNADMDRTVAYDGGSYTAKAKPTGFGFGAMYELTYDIPGDDNGNTVWQPLFNASVIRANLNDFCENSAGDAGLDVRDLSGTLATLALGGRVVTVGGENMFGRGSIFHLRLNVAQDFGDTRSEAKVNLLGNAGFSQKVRASEAGTTAIQAGAGMAVPVGVDAAIYLDFNLDARSRQIALDASLGYRVQL